MLEENPFDPEHASPPQAKFGPWAIALIPHLDAQQVFEAWTDRRYPIVALEAKLAELTADPDSGYGYLSNACLNLSVLQCPTTQKILGDHGRNSYVPNNGFCPTDARGQIVVNMHGETVPNQLNSAFDSSQKKSN